MVTVLDYWQTIENTPLVRLYQVAGKQPGLVLGKVEARNLTGSVKGRTAAGMIQQAEKEGKLKAGIEIIEPTSGNTGIALAAIAAGRGYPLTLVMPESMTMERRKVLFALGARLILTPADEGMEGAIRRAEALMAQDPDHFFMPQQFSNPANPAIHEATTGPEIWRDTDGQVDAVIFPVGTGGTLTGVNRFFKKMRKKVLAIAVEPKESPVISQFLSGQPLRSRPHQIQGIGAGFIPKVLDLSLIDLVHHVASEEAGEFALRLAREEGLLCGISAGAAVAAAAHLRQRKEFKEKTIVVILPDSGERYLSMPWFENGWITARRAGSTKRPDRHDE